MLKRTSILTVAFACFILAITGCQQADFAPVYNVGDVDSYKVTRETVKEVSFEQPSLNKSKLDTTKSVVEMTFDQKVDNVNEDGSVVLDITIKGIKLYSKGQKGVNNDFDSTRDADKKDALNKLIGKSYKIKMDVDGKATVADVSGIKSSATSREAKALISSDAIEMRHSIIPMPEEGPAVIAKNKSWMTLGATPKGALQPKAFEKEYKVESIKDTAEGSVADVKMTAIETNKTVEGFDASSGGLGVMANIFDSTSNYTGDMKYNITTGKLVSYSENLTTEHVAAEEPKGGDPSKGPDVLTMRFISKYSIESVK
ncbi:MAG: hypothetical protein ACIAQZ_08780 [Sedimentisphaeraceae bacterium JB056]